MLYNEQLPSKEDLLKLSIHEVRIYAARNALRVLPFTVGKGEFNYISNNKEKSLRVAALQISALIGIAAIIKEKDINIVNRYVSEAADSANEFSDVAPDSATAYAYPSVYACYSAAIAAHETGADDVIVAAIESSRTSYVADAINDTIADSGLLINNKKIHSEPLWRSNILTTKVSAKIDQWSKSMRNLGLHDYVDCYDKLLNGHNDPQKLCMGLFQKWMSQYKSINPEATNKLSGSLSINAELPCEKDFLGRMKLVNALGSLLEQPEHQEPLVIGILGDWGAGKTTVINLLKERLQKNNNYTNYQVQIFNAWSYEHTENIQAGVTQEVIIGLTKSINGFYEKIKLAWKLNHQINKFKLYGYGSFLGAWFIFIIYLAINGRITSILDIGIGLSLTLLFLYSALKPLFTHSLTKEFATFLKLPDYTSHIGQLPVYKRQVFELSELCLVGNRRLLFVVDDLDRCSPEGIVKVFEAIRLVMDIKKVTVIIAIDPRIALSALADQYKKLADKSRSKDNIARDYLGKIIQLPINLGRPDNDVIKNYLDHLFEGTIEVVKNGTNQISSLDSKLESEELREYDNFQSYSYLEKSSQKKQYTQNMRHSNAEKEHFSLLAVLFAFHNPRQLKRLHSSYRLLRSYTDSIEEVNLQYMSALFWVEYQYSSGGEDLLESCFDKTENCDLLMSTLVKHFPDKNSYQIAKSIIEPFVLPV